MFLMVCCLVDKTEDIMPESIPPLKKVPISTSETLCLSTASIINSEIRSTFAQYIS